MLNPGSVLPSPQQSAFPLHQCQPCILHLCSPVGFFLGGNSALSIAHHKWCHLKDAKNWNSVSYLIHPNLRSKGSCNLSLVVIPATCCFQAPGTKTFLGPELLEEALLG